MQHAFRDRAKDLLSLPRALLLGCGIHYRSRRSVKHFHIRVPRSGISFWTALGLFWASAAWGQFNANDPAGQSLPGAPATGPGVSLSLPRSHRAKPAKLNLDSDDQPPDTPFTLDEPMSAVRIEGNTTIPNSEIAKHIKTRPGRPVTQKQIKDDVDALVRTRWFATVEPSIRRTDDGNVLVFRVLERPIVKKVEYRGNKKIKQKAFDNMTQLKPGQPYDVSVNRECARRIQEYYKEKGYPFATVELERGDVRSDPDREVIFVINEGPKVKVTKVTFDGNATFSDQLLRTKTRSKTVILWYFGGKYDPSSSDDDIEAVREYYHSLGYFDVKIKPEPQFSDDKAKVVLHYDIDEGTRYKINNVSFAGNNVLGDDEIRKMIKVKDGDKYNKRDITKDQEALMGKYGEQGRLFASVIPVPRWSEEPGVLDIVYKINEDKVYRVRNIGIHVDGDTPRTRNNLVRNVSPLHPGDLADPKKITQMKHRLAGSQYFESDPKAGGIRIDTVVVKDTKWLNGPEIDVARGQDGFAGHSILSGEPTTIATPVRRARVAKTPPTSGTTTEPEEETYLVPFKPPENEEPDVEDDHLSPITAVFRGQSMDPLKPPGNNIYDVSPQGDPFGKAINNPDPYDDLNRLPPPEFIDLDTYLTEAKTGRVMFGVGVNSSSGLVGNVVLSEQNFDITKPPTSWNDVFTGKAWRGNGEKFRIEAMPGTLMSRYLVDWTNPYFMDTNNSVGVNGFYFNRYYLNWTEQREGGRLRLGRQLAPFWSASGSLRAENVTIFNPSTPTPPPILEEAIGSHLLTSVQGSLSHDNRNGAFGASAGHHIELSLEQAFGEYNYSRVDLDARKYFTLYQRADGGGKHTLTLRGEVAWTGSDTPIFERFYAGGFQSFRGFYYRGVSPYQQGVYIGGDFMTLGTVEYQLPILANEMVKFVTFSDFGTVNDQVALSNFRVSVGAGFRITIPMLGPTPLAIDFATPLLRNPTDKLQVISFMMGASR